MEIASSPPKRNKIKLIKLRKEMNPELQCVEYLIKTKKGKRKRKRHSKNESEIKK